MRHITAIFRPLFFLFIVWGLAFPALANTQPFVAQVIAVQGQAYAQGKQPKRILKRAEKIYSGDTISTQKNAKVQVRFTDGTMVSLKPTTNFRVDEYHFKDAEKEKYAVTLIKGGLRSVTGTIGKESPLAFNTKTPVATIGVRGTDFIASYSTATKLHVQVEQGKCSLQNDAGTFLLDEGKAMNVESNQSAPEAAPYSAAEAKEYAVVHDDDKAAHEEAAHEEATHEEATHEEATHEEATHEEPAHEEATHEEPAHEEAPQRQDTSNTSSGSEDSHE